MYSVDFPIQISFAPPPATPVTEETPQTQLMARPLIQSGMRQAAADYPEASIFPQSVEKRGLTTQKYLRRICGLQMSENLEWASVPLARAEGPVAGSRNSSYHNTYSEELRKQSPHLYRPVKMAVRPSCYLAR